MKIIAIMGSPRGNGSGYKIVKMIEKRMKTMGKVEFECGFVHRQKMLTVVNMAGTEKKGALSALKIALGFARNTRIVHELAIATPPWPQTEREVAKKELAIDAAAKKFYMTPRLSQYRVSSASASSLRSGGLLRYAIILCFFNIPRL